METFVKPVGSFIRHGYLPHIGLTALLILASDAVLSFRNLDAGGAAKVMEMYAALSGILLIVPLFMPEADAEIWSLERTKRLPMWQLYLGRLAVAVLLTGGTMGMFLLRLSAGKSEFHAGLLWLTAFSEAVFLGAAGYFVSAVTNQAVLGYMVSLLYYITNIGAADRLGVFGLFPLMRGVAAHWEVFLGCGILLIVAGIVIRERKK